MATTSKPSYYSALNRLGFILELIRFKILSRHTLRKSNEQIHMHDDESSVTLTDDSVPSNANLMLSISSCSLTQPHEVMPWSSYMHTQTITPQLSTESSTITALKIDTETISYLSLMSLHLHLLHHLYPLLNLQPIQCLTISTILRSLVKWIQRRPLRILFRHHIRQCIGHLCPRCLISLTLNNLETEYSKTLQRNPKLKAGKNLYRNSLRTTNVL